MSTAFRRTSREDIGHGRGSCFGLFSAIFDMVIGGEISPETVMNSVLESERYAAVG